LRRRAAGGAPAGPACARGAGSGRGGGARAPGRGRRAPVAPPPALPLFPAAGTPGAHASLHPLAPPPHPGCGKSTFMRRMTGIFGGTPKPPAGAPPRPAGRPGCVCSGRAAVFPSGPAMAPCLGWRGGRAPRRPRPARPRRPLRARPATSARRVPPLTAPSFPPPPPPPGGNPDSNTLISDMTTVICLDDYHSLDRKGRSAAGVTALDPKAQHFDLMHQQARRAGALQGQAGRGWAGRGGRRAIRTGPPLDALARVWHSAAPLRCAAVPPCCSPRRPAPLPSLPLPPRHNRSRP
jgi:hypothetical protein